MKDYDDLRRLEFDERGNPKDLQAAVKFSKLLPKITE